MYSKIYASVVLARRDSRLASRDSRLARRVSRLARRESRLARRETRGGNLLLSGTVVRQGLNIFRTKFSTSALCNGRNKNLQQNPV